MAGNANVRTIMWALFVLSGISARSRRREDGPSGLAHNLKIFGSLWAMFLQDF